MLDKPLQIKKNKKIIPIAPFLGDYFWGTVGPQSESALIHVFPLGLLDEVFASDEEKILWFEGLEQIRHLNHYNILPLQEFWKDEESLYLFYRCNNGVLLSETMGTQKRSLDEAMKSSIEIASAIDAAHRNGIIHGHLSPDDILVDDLGRMRVFQFGFSLLLAPLMQKEQIPQGEVQYLYPAIYHKEKISIREDIFSIGTIFYQLLTRVHPFQNKSSQELKTALLHKEPHPLRAIDISLPSALDAIVRKCLAKKTTDRFESLSELIGDLKDHRFRGKLAERPEESIKNIVKRSFNDEHSMNTKNVIEEEIEKTNILSQSAERQKKDAVTLPIPKTPQAMFQTGDMVQADSLADLLDKDVPPDDDLYEKPKIVKKHWLSFWTVVGTFMVLVLLVFLKTFGIFPFSPDDALFGRVPSADENRQYFLTKKIDKLFREASIAFQNENYVEPMGESAYDYYSAILKLEPQNTKALEYVAELKIFLFRQSRAAFDKEDYRKAFDLARQFLLIEPERTEVAELMKNAEERIPTQKEEAKGPTPENTPEKAAFVPIKEKGFIIFLPYNGESTKSGILNLETDEIKEFVSFPNSISAPRYYADTHCFVYGAYKNGVGKIVRFEVKTKKQTVLLENSYKNRSPALSPDGKQLAFVSYRLGQWDLFIRSVAAGNTKQLTFDSFEDDNPDFSPNGKWLIYQSHRPAGWEIGKINTAGGTAYNLTQNRSDDIRPLWSSNGRSILFSSNQNLDWDVFIMDSSGRHQRNITASFVPELMPCFSPDEKKILYLEGKEGSQKLVFHTLSSGYSVKINVNQHGITWLDWVEDMNFP